MEKTVTYRSTYFDEPTIRLAMATLRQAVEIEGEALDRFDLMRSESGHEEWYYDGVDELLADLTRGASNPEFRYGGFKYEVFLPGKYDERSAISFGQRESWAGVGVLHTDRGVIERVHSVFQNATVNLYSPPPPEPTPPKPKPRVFIGHGGASTQWRLLKDHLVDQHGYDVVAYETGARAGHTIRDVLSDMLGASNFALLVMTAEDEQADGAMRARQNVVHEAGLFQGKLGFARAIILLEEGVENLSNLDGIQYIPFSRDRIREAFGDVLATIRREFGD